MGTMMKLGPLSTFTFYLLLTVVLAARVEANTIRGSSPSFLASDAAEGCTVNENCPSADENGGVSLCCLRVPGHPHECVRGQREGKNKINPKKGKQYGPGNQCACTEELDFGLVWQC